MRPGEEEEPTYSTITCIGWLRRRRAVLSRGSVSDEHEVTKVYKAADTLAGDKDRISSIDGIGQCDESAH